MSRSLARNVVERLNGRPALIAPQYVGGSEVTSSGMLFDLRELASADVKTEEDGWAQRKQELLQAYGYNGDPINDGKVFAFRDGKAIIPVHGLLINRFNYSWSFATGYNFIRSQLAAASADPDVDGIILDVNSPGGTAAGCEETADAIYAASRRQDGKPILAVVDANCFSAAYMLACSADRIAVTPSGYAGSIGVVLMHVDLSKALADFGIKISFIYAGAHKVDGTPTEPLSDEVRADYQAVVNAVYDRFVAKVVRGRDMGDQDVRDTEARCYSADEALSIGLIDSVQNPDNAVEVFFSDDPGDDATDPSEPEREPAVAQKPSDTQPAAAAAPVVDPQAAAADARAAERARISGIQGHAEAAGRADLASYLALSTDLSVEAAAGILAAAPKAAAAPVAAAAPSAEVTSTDTNHFANAMNAGKQPNVGAGAEGSNGEAKTETAASRILSAQRMATGVKPAQQ